MATVIIRNLDDGLVERLKHAAQECGLSLDKYLSQLLAQSLRACQDGESGDVSPRNDLRRLAGRWTAGQAREFKAAVAPFSAVAPKMWT